MPESVDRKLDCSACGRTDVTFEKSYNVCNRVHCPVFEKLKPPPSGRVERFFDKLGEAFKELLKP